MAVDSVEACWDARCGITYGDPCGLLGREAAQAGLSEGALLGCRDTTLSGHQGVAQGLAAGQWPTWIGFRIGILYFHEISPYSDLLDLVLSPWEVGLCLSSLHIL